MLGDREVEWIVEYSTDGLTWVLYARTKDLILAENYLTECSEAYKGIVFRLREVRYTTVKEA